MHRWQFNAITGCTEGGDARLTHDSGAELWVRAGRLTRGDGYAVAPAESRRELARAGAILRLRSRGRYHLHASGVVAPDGRGWALTGASGSGKSTLAYALARRGWRVLGDDGVVIELTSSTAIVHAWREALWVSTNLQASFGELTALAHRAVPGDARSRLPMAMPVARRAPLAGIVSLEQGPDDRITRLGAVDALVELVRQSAWVLIPDDAARTHLAALRRMAAEIPMFRLVHTPRQLLTIAETLSSLG